MMQQQLWLWLVGQVQVRGDLKLCSCSLSYSLVGSLFVVQIERWTMLIIDAAMDDVWRIHDEHLRINRLAIEMRRDNDDLHPRKSLPPTQATQTTSTCPDSYILPDVPLYS